LKLYQRTEFHDRMLTGSSSASTSKVRTPAILKCLKLWD